MGTLHLPNLLTDLSFILKRLWRQRGLVACVALGLMVATARAVNIKLHQVRLTIPCITRHLLCDKPISDPTG